MKTIVSTILIFSFCMVASFGQLRIGLRGGVSSSSITADDIRAGNVTLKTVSDAMVGYHFGLIMQAKLMGAYLQPELLFSSTGGKVRLADTDNNIDKILEQKFSRIDIPIIVGVTFGPARLGVGPVASIIINSKSELRDYQNYDDKFKTATIGYQADLGLDIWKLAFDLKYEGNLSKLGDSVNIGSTNYAFDSRGHQFIFSIGLFF